MLARWIDSRTHYAKGKRSQSEDCFHSLWTHDFRSISLRSPRFFSPFPHGTSSLSVIMEYLALESGLPGFRRSFTCSALLGIPVGVGEVFGYGAFTRFGRTFQTVRLTNLLPCPGPATPEGKPSGLGSCAFARHYLRNRNCFLLLQVLRCFTSLSVARTGLLNSSRRNILLKILGFPIRKPPGQSLLTANRRLSQSSASFIAS